jgi:membrane associated rhomboid family serine protease
MTPAAVGLRCPEHSGKPQGVRRITSAATRPATGIGARTGNLVTLALIGINVAVFALELAIGGSLDGTNNWIYEHGVLVREAVYGDGTLAGVANGEWWRLETATFLHYGLIHLALNMFSLYFAGSILEQLIGRWRFLLVYVVSGVAGSAGALLMSKPTALTAGASGAIFGVLGALFVLERRGRIATGGQVLGLILLNLAFTFAIPGISVGGHLGGLVGGMLVMLAFDRFRTSPELSIASAAVVAVASIVVAYTAI